MQRDAQTPTNELTLVLASEKEKQQLMSQWERSEGITPLPQTESELLQVGHDVFLIQERSSNAPKGYAVVVDYPEVSRAKEIILRPHEPFASMDSFRSIVAQLIGILSENRSIDRIMLKIDDESSDQAQVLESLGFMKEALVMNNFNPSGVFAFFTIYQYKLS
ncbi:hypothetical protein ABB02_00370 [Clostridiaceae bacterium JG1575]|nr:hypothetical protein ABB02_00370 [Clostridiaceae bacterium JG1575]